MSTANTWCSFILDQAIAVAEVTAVVFNPSSPVVRNILERFTRTFLDECSCLSIVNFSNDMALDVDAHSERKIQCIYFLAFSQRLICTNILVTVDAGVTEQITVLRSLIGNRNYYFYHGDIRSTSCVG